MTYDEVFTFDNLLNSSYKCFLGVGWKASTQLYKEKQLLNAYKTYTQLKNRTYKSKGFYEFTINERGKTRRIRSVHISERVVQKCLCDYYLLPLLSPSLIYDNGACLKGKGFTFTFNRLKYHLSKYYRENKTNKGYVLRVDFKEYFDNINHSILKGMLDKKIDDNEIKKILYDFIDNFGDKGLGLGSQISQILALYYASSLDHYIKERLHIKHYDRYMDDLYLIHTDKYYLKFCLLEIRRICDNLNITINENKTHISRLENGISFLQQRYRLSNAGKVYILPNKKDFKRYNSKVEKLTEDKVKVLYTSLKGTLKRTNCYWRLRTYGKRI